MSVAVLVGVVFAVGAIGVTIAWASFWRQEKARRARIAKWLEDK